MGSRRVAITGAGAVSALGTNLREFYSSLAEARPGIRRLPPDSAQGSGVQVGALVQWDPAPLLTPPRAVMSNSFAFGGSNVVLIAEHA